MKKIIAFLLTAVLVFGAVACTKQPTNDGAAINTGDAKYPASDTPITLTVFGLDRIPFDNDYPVFKEAANYTNVTLRGVIPKSVSDEAQAFNTMVSSGELADIIMHYKDEINKYGAEGMYAPLNDLIDEHAPHIKAFLAENDDVKRFITAADGNIYCIPFVPAGETAKGWFVREDWLENLNMEVPTDLDGFYDMLVAFRDDDPNGNGIKDEVPYFNRGKSDGVLDLAIFWGGYPSWYVKDGVVHYGSIEPEFKEAMTQIAKWYEEGLIDKEIYLRDPNARELFLGDNTGGVTHDWVGSTAQYNDQYQKQNPNFKFAVIAPPTGVETSRRERLRQEAWGLSSTNVNLEASIKYMDFFFTEEGQRLMNFGIEGTHYDLVDGKAVFKPEVLNSDKTVLDTIKESGAQMAMGFLQDFEYEKQWLNQFAIDGMDMYTSNDYMDEIPVFMRTVEEDKRYASLITAIRTYQEESFQKWVLGVEKVEASWDKYLNEMNRLNIEEMIEIQQSAYDRFMNN